MSRQTSDAMADPFGLLDDEGSESYLTSNQSGRSDAILHMASAYGNAMAVKLVSTPFVPAPARRTRASRAKSDGTSAAASAEVALSPSPPPASMHADTENECPRCQGRMMLSEHEYVCEECRYVQEADGMGGADGEDDGPKKAMYQSRLRVVGPRASAYQPDLDRSSNSSDNAAAQIRQIFEEFLSYRIAFIATGGRAYPEEAFQRAAEMYNDVQKHHVKRSQNKLTIMAACLWFACVELEFVPPKSEVARLMQLQRGGIARGENSIRAMAAVNQTSIEVNRDTCKQEINTTFLNLKEVGERLGHLMPAVEAVVRHAIKKKIGTSSLLRSKVVATTFIVFQRHARVSGTKCISQQELCQLCQIRKNTIDNFTLALTEYHSQFEALYLLHGLDPTAPH
jgi:transcription initiation factor TFIIIB Brf1 subunit/transcription initiation factor TFIIB